MECERIREQLGVYLDGAVSSDARREVEAHLSGCPCCADELASLERLAQALSPQHPVAVPDALWTSIEKCLDGGTNHARQQVPSPTRLRFLRRPLAAAASVVLVIGLGMAGIALLTETGGTAQASAIDFSILLDSLPLDAHKALRRFLTRYDARQIPPQTARAQAPDLDFEVPDSLPGGFRRQAVYALRFGNAPGIAAEYYRDDGEFLAALFHPPVQQQDYGTHRDRPCVVGQHRGHTVEVGRWRLVHLTDPTTCHCVLSRLHPERELPAVMAAVAPRSTPSGHHEHGRPVQDRLQD